MQTYSLDKARIKVLLLEGVHQTAVEAFQASGYVTLDYRAKALPEDQLCEAIADAHIVGIRSRTQLSDSVLEAARKLMAIGCFCIGTNQVDLAAAGGGDFALVHKTELRKELHRIFTGATGHALNAFLTGDGLKGHRH